MADELGSGLPPDDLNSLASFINDLIQGSPYPSLGPNDPPEWRRERARERLMDAASRTVYGKSMGEVRPEDVLAAILSLVPVGRFAPAARGGNEALSGVIAAARAGEGWELTKNLFKAWRNAIPTLPTHELKGYRDLVLYGRLPARRVPALGRLPDLLERLIQAGIDASQSSENTPPGSVNPVAMP